MVLFGIVIISFILLLVFVGLGYEEKNQNYDLAAGFFGFVLFVAGLSLFSKHDDKPRSKNDLKHTEEELIAELKLDKIKDEQHLKKYIDDISYYQSELEERLDTLTKHKAAIEKIADEEYDVISPRLTDLGRPRSNAVDTGDINLIQI